jgi:hypothetical protein
MLGGRGGVVTSLKQHSKKNWAERITEPRKFQIPFAESIPVADCACEFLSAAHYRSIVILSEVLGSVILK